jgi:hypothetical protein
MGAQIRNEQPVLRSRLQGLISNKQRGSPLSHLDMPSIANNTEGSLLRQFTGIAVNLVLGLE